jgi:hypothetical protein
MSTGWCERWDVAPIRGRESAEQARQALFALAFERVAPHERTLVERDCPPSPASSVVRSGTEILTVQRVPHLQTQQVAGPEPTGLEVERDVPP